MQITWQLTTILTRFTSFTLLAYVYYEHWLEVGWSNIQIAVAETIPFLMLLILLDGQKKYIMNGQLGSLNCCLILKLLINLTHKESSIQFNLN